MEERHFKRIDKKLSTLLEVKSTAPKLTLVRVSVVQSLTGLDKEGLRKARQNNLITQVKRPDGIWYELESIHPVIKKHEHATL